jgi:hypothetical protein
MCELFIGFPTEVRTKNKKKTKTKHKTQNTKTFGLFGPLFGPLSGGSLFFEFFLGEFCWWVWGFGERCVRRR